MSLMRQRLGSLWAASTIYDAEVLLASLHRGQCFYARLVLVEDEIGIDKRSKLGTINNGSAMIYWYDYIMDEVMAVRRRLSRCEVGNSSACSRVQLSPIPADLSWLHAQLHVNSIDIFYSAPIATFHCNFNPLRRWPWMALCQQAVSAVPVSRRNSQWITDGLSLQF